MTTNWVAKPFSAFGAAVPRLWNDLPVNIQASGTLSVFRKRLKTYLNSKDIIINSNCCEMTDDALEYLFSVIHVLISVYVLD